MSKRLIVVALLFTLPLSAMAAKKPAKPEANAPAVPAHNVLDLRSAVFNCVQDACALEINGVSLIGCNAKGCASITDIVVAPGPVLRQGVYAPQVPAPSPAPAAAPSK